MASGVAATRSSRPQLQQKQQQQQQAEATAAAYGSSSLRVVAAAATVGAHSLHASHLFLALIYSCRVNFL